MGGRVIMVLLLSVLCAWALAGGDQEAGLIELTAFTAPSRQLDIASPVGGVVAKVHVEEGQRVEAGQLLVELKADLLRAQLEVSRANIDSAQLQIEVYEKTYQTRKTEYEGTAALTAQGIESAEERDKARLAMEIAELSIAYWKAEKRVRELQAARDLEAVRQTMISAPIAGEVHRVLVREGEAAEPLKPVVNLVAIDPLDVIAHAPIQTAARIKEGSEAILVLEDGPGKPLRCTVAVVDRVADAASGMCRVKLTLPNPDRKLTAGARGLVRITQAP